MGTGIIVIRTVIRLGDGVILIIPGIAVVSAYSQHVLVYDTVHGSFNRPIPAILRRKESYLGIVVIRN